LSLEKMTMPAKPSIDTEPRSLVDQVTPPADRPFIDLSRALLRASFLFSVHPDRAYHAFDLTLAQVDVLMALGNSTDASLTCSEIAEKTLMTKGGITGILDRLEARGLVKRIHSREDRRSVTVRLSAKGIELFRKLCPALGRSNRAIFEKIFGPEQHKEFGKFLHMLIRGLET
jgi:MarR family transcriptional regulator, 2-MHQ and catechol-resistance regulon repressor